MEFSINGGTPNWMVYSGTTIYSLSDDWDPASRGALVQFQGTPEVFMKTLGAKMEG